MWCKSRSQVKSKKTHKGNQSEKKYKDEGRRAKKTQREKKNSNTEKECWKQRKETVSKENADDLKGNTGSTHFPL